MRIPTELARRPMLAPALGATLLVQTLLQGGAVQAASSSSNSYQRTSLVSDLPGVARVTDPHLVNPWGLSASPTGPFWVSDNGTGLATIYDGHGTPSSLVVTVPPPAGSSGTAAPTGNVFNPTSDFVVMQGGTSGPSQFIFATEDGTISGWNPAVNPTMAVLAVDNSASGAVYKGLALGSNARGNFLFAANFHAGTVDVFDAHFTPATLAGSFHDPALPAGYAPFNIANIGGQLFVTYAVQDADKHDDVPGSGHGFIDVFDTNGNLVRRFTSHGPLNSPWGLALAPADFGKFSGDLLVGNFGDGRINAFDPTSGAFLGTLRDREGNPIAIPGLWALRFGNGGQAGDPHTLFFTAGIVHEQHGLFGSLQHQDE